MIFIVRSLGFSLLAFTLGVAGATLGVAGAARGAEPAPDPAELIRRLDADDYAVREAATAALAKCDAAAVPLLERAIAEGSPEAAWRALSALELLGVQGSEEATMLAVCGALERLTASGKVPKSNETVQRVLALWRVTRHQRAAERLQSLGAVVQSHYGLAQAAYSGPVYGGTMYGGGGGGFGSGILVSPSGVIEVYSGPSIGDEELFEEIEDVALEPTTESEPLSPEDSREVPPSPTPAPSAERIPTEASPRDSSGKEPTSPETSAPDSATPPPSLLPPVAEPDVEIRELPEVEVLPSLEGELDLEGELSVLEVPDFEFTPYAVPSLAPAVTVSSDGETPWPQQTKLTLGREWRGTAADLSLAAQLLGLHEVEIQGRELDRASLLRLAAIPSLGKVTLQNAPHSRRMGEALTQARPGMEVWAFGTAVLGVAGEPAAGGYQVTFVAPDSGAARAGIRPGDLLRRLQGVEIDGFSTLTQIVAERSPGDTVTVTLEREGEAVEIAAVLGAREEAVSSTPRRIYTAPGTYIPPPESDYVPGELPEVEFGSPSP